MALMGLKSARRGIEKALAFAGRLLRNVALFIGWFTEEILTPIPAALDIIMSRSRRSAVALMGLKGARRGIKKALAFAGRLLEKLASFIGWVAAEILFPIPGLEILISWFWRWPFLLYPPLIMGCYAFALWDTISSKNYYLAIVLAITGAWLIAVMRLNLQALGDDGRDEVELPDSKLTKRAEAAIAQVPANIRAQYHEIMVARDIPVEVRTFVCELVVGAVEGKFPKVDWTPLKAVEDLDARVPEFLTALGTLDSWMRSRQAMLKALGDAGRAGLLSGELVKTAGGHVPTARNMVREMAGRGELVMRKEGSAKRYWLPEHAPVSDQGPLRASTTSPPVAILRQGFKAKITLYPDRIVKGGESHPLVGVSADVISWSAGTFLTVGGPEFMWVQRTDGVFEGKARKFAAMVNATVTVAAMVGERSGRKIRSR